MDQGYADWKDWQVADFGRSSTSEARYFAWQVDRALPGRQGLAVLELGYGNGSLMGWLHGQGHRVCGVEASPVLVERARAAGFEAHLSLQALGSERRFDLVAAIDVLEHVPAAELVPLLRDLAAMLASGGRLWLRFPNGESPFGLASQHGDLTHVNVLSASRLRQAAPAAGLQLLLSGDQLPWRRLPAGRRPGAWLAHLSRRAFEWRMRKSYGLGRQLDFTPNQSVILGAADTR